LTSFVKNYWRGKIPLNFTLWLIFLGLLIVLSLLEPLILEKLFADPENRIRATYISLIVTRGIIFIWLFIGLLRANEKDYLEFGNTVKTRAIQALLLTSVLFTLVYSVETLQAAYFNKDQQQFKQVNSVPQNYSLTLKENVKWLYISGDLELGITRKVRELLKLNPAIRDVVLESPGGQIYEGRGLSFLFTEMRLNTHVYNACSSACATAFVGGRKRIVGNHAKIGFHRYRQDTSKYYKAVPFYDLNAEQNRDLAIFRSQGVRDGFLRKVFAKESNAMWFPQPSELLRERVVDEIIPAF
jgi:hypothetical protein